MVKLINLPQLNSLDDKLDPPLGLMYIASALRVSGMNVKIVDLCFVPRRLWPEAIGDADIYGMTVFSSSLHLAKQVAEICKKNNPRCRVVVGGPHPTTLPYETLEFFDTIVQGEGEFAFSYQREPIMKMDAIEDLDVLPYPARDLVNLKAYTRKVAAKPATSVTTSRGCPYRCAFCCKDVHGYQVRYFSIGRVLAELKHIIRNYDFKSFIFYDDTFALDRDRFYPLCEQLEKLNITFRCNGDSRNNTIEDFKVLKRAGCKEISFGIESGSQKILDRIRKGTTVERNFEAIKNAKKAGIFVKAFLMIGNPGETPQTIAETKAFIQQAKPDQYTLFNFIPLPGCDVWKNPDKYGMKIVSKDYQQYFNIAGENVGGSVVDSDTFTHDDLAAWRKDLLSSLPPQRGALQDYYMKVKA